MPLVAGLYAIIFDGKSLKDIVTALMMGEHADDVESSVEFQ